jgi:hypothetical protein
VLVDEDGVSVGVDERDVRRAGSFPRPFDELNPF